MSAINHSTNYLWQNRGMILPLSLGIPAAIGAASLGTHIYKTRGEIKSNILHAKDLVIQSFTRRENETPEEFRKRIVKNTFIAIGASISLSALIGASCILPFFVLPSLFAIPIAIAGISSVGDLLVNGRSYCRKWKQRYVQGKAFLHDSFTAKKGESKEAAKKRILKNTFLAIGVTTLALGALGALCFGISYLVLYALHAWASGGIGIWNLYDLFPIHSKLGITLTYAGVGALHTMVGVHKWRKGDKLGALFHFACLPLSLYFPLHYWKTASAANPMRFHHSILGLLLQLSPFRALRFYGSLVTLDSGVNNYFFQHDGAERQYDLQSLVVRHLKPYISALAGLSAVEFFSRRILPEEKTLNRAHG